MTDQEQFEAHMKSTAWYGVLSQAATDDDDGASVFRMARMAAHEAWNASQVLIEQQAARIRDLEAVEVMRDNEIAYVRQKHGEALEIIDGLRAARIAYASEFPPDAEGLPDVGSIHANIRAMKARIAPVAPAVDAQPVAVVLEDEGVKLMAFLDNSSTRLNEGDLLYTTPQSEGWRKALTEIAEQEHIELMLDPTWAQRVAVSALSQKEPQ